MRSLQGTRVFVTGAGGMVGRAAVVELARLGARVTALVGPPRTRTHSPGVGAAESFAAEIDDVGEILPRAEGAEIVVHLAGPPSVAESFREPARYARVHGVGTAAMLEVARSVGTVSRFVYVSSGEVYGVPLTAGPIAEAHPLAPRSPYAAAKLAGEAFVAVCAPEAGFDAIILRPFSIYGSRASRLGMAGSVIAQVARGGEVAIDDADPVRDFCFVDDVAEAIGAACSREPGEPVAIYNVGTGVGTSVAGFVAAALDAAGRAGASVRVVRRADRPAHSRCAAMIADVRRAGCELRWTARHALRDGLARALGDFAAEAAV